jgi:hypothetical protein
MLNDMYLPLNEYALELAQCTWRIILSSRNAGSGDEGSYIGHDVTERGKENKPVDGLAKILPFHECSYDEEGAEERQDRHGALGGRDG